MPFEDIGIMRMVPGLDIVEPSDPVSLAALVRALSASPKPGYLRLHRKAIDPIYKDGEKFELGKGKLLREGSDVTIVALGAIMVPEALKAADLLAKDGIKAAVIDALSAKPIDRELVMKWAAKTGAVVTAENHQASGGLGSAVAELLAETGEARLARVGIEDEFGEVGTQDWLQQRFKLTADNIASKAMALVAGRK
jgi:transketolase